MQDTGKTLCPFCAGKIPAVADLCMHCGRDLHSIILARSQSRPKRDCYEIVPDGDHFAISFSGDIKIHGLDSTQLERAREIAKILNSFIENEQVG